MPNDINMLQDIEDLDRNNKTEQATLLGICYHYKFNESNILELEKAKQLYIKKYGWIENYV